MGEYTDFKKKISPVPSPILNDEQVSPMLITIKHYLKLFFFKDWLYENPWQSEIYKKTPGSKVWGKFYNIWVVQGFGLLKDSERERIKGEKQGKKSRGERITGLGETGDTMK